MVEAKLSSDLPLQEAFSTEDSGIRGRSIKIAKRTGDSEGIAKYVAFMMAAILFFEVARFGTGDIVLFEDSEVDNQFMCVAKVLDARYIHRVPKFRKFLQRQGWQYTLEFMRFDNTGRYYDQERLYSAGKFAIQSPFQPFCNRNQMWYFCKPDYYEL